MSTPSPEKLLEDIKSWTTEKTKLVIRAHDNPKAHFSIWVSPSTPHIIIPIMVAYPKDSNKIIMGWNWTPEDLDIKAYAALNDRERKESVRRILRDECMTRGLTIGINPTDVDRLEKLAISKTILINDFTKDNYRKALSNLMDMWFRKT